MEKLSHKTRTRQRIVDEAAVATHRCGNKGIGIAALMKRADKFYVRLFSREALMEAVIAPMFTGSSQRFANAVSLGDSVKRTGDYLPEQHHPTPGAGYRLAALVSERAHLPFDAGRVFSLRCAAIRGRLACACLDDEARNLLAIRRQSVKQRATWEVV